MHLHRTNIELDKRLVNKALKVTGIQTKKALIDFALKELIRHKTQAGILQLEGKVHWKGNLTTSRLGRLSAD